MPKVVHVKNPRGDTIPPSVPQSVAATALASNSVQVTWSPSTDASGVGGYQVYRNGVPVGSSVGTSYVDNTAAPSTTYSYTVAAYDIYSNTSTQSAAAQVTTPANDAPAWTVVQQELTVGSAYSLSLPAVCTDPEGVTLTFSYVSGTFPTGVAFNSVTKAISGTPTVVGLTSVVMRASDGVNATDQLITFNVLNADTTAPSVPAGLTATAVSKAQVNLSWTAATDATVASARTSGLSGYRIYRDGLLRTTLGAVTNYSDTGLSAGTLYSYTIAAFDVAGNASAQSAAASATTQAMNTPPVFVTAANLGPVTANQPFSIQITATDADEDIITFSVVDSLPGDAMLTPNTQVAGTRTAALASATGVAEGTYTFTLKADDGQAGDAESDWLLRSTGAGVVWAHDFRTDREVYNFLDFKSSAIGSRPSSTTGNCQPDYTDGVSGTGGGCVALTFPSNPPHVVQSITGIATNRTRIVLNEPHDYSAATLDLVRFQNVPSGPWSQGSGQSTPTLNDWRKGAGGTCVLWKVTNIVNATTFDIDTQTVIQPSAGWAPMGDVSGFAPYVGSSSPTIAPQDLNLGMTTSVIVTSARIATGDWHRPFSAFVGGTTTGNGRGAGLDDIGIANGSSPSRLWTPVDGTGAIVQTATDQSGWSANAAVFTGHSKDLYGYAGYGSVLDTWKTYSSHLAQSGMYRGDDFWIQYRQKLPLGRYQLGNAPIRNPDIKLISPWTNINTPAHEIHQSDLNLPLAKFQQVAWPLNSGGLPRWYTNQNAPSSWDGQNSLQSYGTYDSTCRYINPQAGTTFPNVSSCFHWPPDEWCAVLWHIKMGYGWFEATTLDGTPVSPQGDMSALWSSWGKGGANPALSTAVQLFVCPQSRIDAARANGVAPTWIAVFNNYGATGYPLNQAQAYRAEFTPASLDPDQAGPFFNTLWMNRYQNSIPIYYGYTKKFTQFIFKKGSGGFDPYVDGIACPRY